MATASPSDPQSRLRASACVVACAIALTGGYAAAPASAAIRADSVGIYSEELERANAIGPFAVAAAQHDAGIGIVRQTFSWARIETSPGLLDFSVYDDVVATAAGAGLTVLPVLVDPPSWRSTAPPTGAVRGMYPPRDPADMAVLATALARRYGPDGSFWPTHPSVPRVPIHSWQVWNEPNIRAFWATGPDPAAYVDLLRAVGSAIRAVDSDAEIVAAGLPLGDDGLTIAQFIDAMYAADARGAFDTLAIHPYASNASNVLMILWSVRAQLDALGDPSRRIWATEFGWATGGPPVTITMSEARQATTWSDAVDLLRRARTALRLRGFIAFRWRDVPPNRGQADLWALHTGLVRTDGSAKPALDALREAVTTWRSEPTAAERLTMPPAVRYAQAAQKRSPETGVHRRRLLIRRFVKGGRLHVRVDVPPGGGGRRVRISYVPVSNGHAGLRYTRRAATRKHVARVVFKLGRRARSAQVLRITATQGAASATRALRLRTSR